MHASVIKHGDAWTWSHDLLAGGPRGHDRLIDQAVEQRQTVSHNDAGMRNWSHDRLADGTGPNILTERWSTPGCQLRTTACIEYLHVTFQARRAPRGWGAYELAGLPETLTNGMQVVRYVLLSTHGRAI